MILKGKNALVTGTNRGIGKAILETFAYNGINILAHARRETPEFISFIRSVEKKYNIKVIPVYFDITDHEVMKTVLKDLIKSRINIDILVNNAAVPHGGFFQMTPIRKIREIYEINLFSQMEITQIVLKSMMKQKSGSIVNIASIAGLDSKPGNSAYGSSKAAMISWTRILAVECASYGIRVNAIAPGLIETNMAENMEEGAREEVINNSSMKRLGKPEEIANAVLFLASDESSFVNGQVIRVDGGHK